MSRRTFIALIVVGLGIGAIPVVRRIRRSKYEPLIEPLIIASILTKDEIHELGKTYINHFPEENSIDVLDTKLRTHHEANQPIQEHIAKKIAADFKSDNTIMIEGWILSITEARQCALFSKLN